MKQITRWDDLVGKTITGVDEFYTALILEDEYCVFDIDVWSDSGEIVISDKKPNITALLELGFITTGKYNELVNDRRASAKALNKKRELEALARLKAKYEEK